MMVMGYFIGFSRKTSKQLVFRGVMILLLGLLLNIGLNFNLLLKIKFESWQFDPLQFILGVDIFFLAGLSIIILVLLKRIKKWQEGIVLLLIIGVIGSTSFLNSQLLVSNHNYILPFIAGEYTWSYFPLFPWLSYPLLGFLFQRKEKNIRAFIQNQKVVFSVLTISILIFVMMFSKFGFEMSIDLPKYYHHTFPFFLWTIGVNILWVILLWSLSKRFSGFPVLVFLRWLGKNITAFYIIQWLIIGNIATEIYQTKGLSDYTFWYVPIFLMTLGNTWMFVNRKRLIKSIFTEAIL